MLNFKQELMLVERTIRGYGMNPTTLCRRAGVSPSQWSRWRAGNTTPNLRTWQRIMDTAIKFKPKEATRLALPKYRRPD